MNMTRSLHAKINAALLVTGVVIAVIFGAVLYPFEISRYNARVRNIEILLETVYKHKRDDLANELFARQKRALAASLEDMTEIEGISGVSVFTPNGEHFLSMKDVYASRISPTERAALAEGNPLFTRKTLHNQTYGVYVTSIEVIGEQIGYLKMYYTFARLERESRWSVFIFLTVLLTTLLLMLGLLNLLLSRSVMYPILELRDAMSRVQEGRLGETVAITSHDEIGQVSIAFNEMSGRLREGRIALKEAEKKYREIFEHAVEGIYQSTPDGRFLNVNPAFARIYGYDSAEEFLACITDIPRQIYVRPEERETFKRLLEQEGGVFDFEVQVYRKDGSIIWVSESARRVFDAQGEQDLYEGSLVDITERKRAEEELRQHRDHLEELVQARTRELTDTNKHLMQEIARREHIEAELQRAKEAAERASYAKSEFLSNMSHELRTPLNGILGYAQILQRHDTLTPQQQDALEIIYQSGEHLLTLINDILDLAKIEARKMELFPTTFHFPTFLEGIAGIIHMRAQEKGLHFQFEADESLPTAIQADEKRLRQILLNLLNNAVKFTDTGTVTLVVRHGAKRSAVADSVPHNERIRFEVRDTGTGMSQSQLEKIFVPFEQVGEHHRRGEGTGLGLPISRKFVELMGSELHVTSEDDKGSTFQFEVELPVVQMETGRSLPDERIILGYKGARRKVLVVDDRPHNCSLLVNALAPLGFEVYSAKNGREAIEQAIQHRPHIILMDLIMPVLSGFEATREIRHIPELQDVVIFGASASVFERDRQQAQKAGCDEFIAKPINIGQLLTLIGKYLKLEWIYKNGGGKRPPSPDRADCEEAPKEIPLPPRHELNALYELAEVGDIMGIRRRAEALREHSPDLSSFADILDRFAKGFEEKELLHFLEQQITRVEQTG